MRYSELCLNIFFLSFLADVSFARPAIVPDQPLSYTLCRSSNEQPEHGWAFINKVHLAKEPIIVTRSEMSNLNTTTHNVAKDIVSELDILVHAESTDISTEGRGDDGGVGHKKFVLGIETKMKKNGITISFAEDSNTPNNGVHCIYLKFNGTDLSKEEIKARDRLYRRISIHVIDDPRGWRQSLDHGDPLDNSTANQRAR